MIFRHCAGNRVRRIWLMWATILMCLVSHLRGQERPNVLTVCEILSTPSKYADRIVEVKGEFFSGRHGIFLLQRQCELNASDTSPSICVVGAGSLDAPQVDFSDQETPALRAIGIAQRALQELDSKFVSHAVLEGRLFLASPGATGFCANNSSPAKIVVKTIRHYSVTHTGHGIRGKKVAPK